MTQSRRGPLSILALAVLLLGLSSATVAAGATTKNSASSPSITISPSTGLQNNEIVSVIGRNFPAKTALVIVECNPGVLKNQSAACASANVVSVTTTAAGTLAKTTFHVMSGAVGNGACGTTASNLTCYLFVSEPSAASRVAADAKIVFAKNTTPSCTTSGLVIWLDTQSSGVAGGAYYNLELTNESGHACSLEGYPAVSAVNDVGHQLGSAASKNQVRAPSLVTLSSATTTSPISRSDTATVVLKITDVGVYAPSRCGYALAAGLRVAPPREGTTKLVTYPFTACAHSGPIVLTVEAIEAGVIPG